MTADLRRLELYFGGGLPKKSIRPTCRLQASVRSLTQAAAMLRCAPPVAKQFVHGSNLRLGPERQIFSHPWHKQPFKMPPCAATDGAPVHEVAKDGFSKQVDAYEQGRPSYPAAAVDYALDTLQLRAGHKRVIDLAAGTGKLTRLLAAHANLDITAVEPNEAMVDGFKSAVPGVPILQGTAQQLPFADGTVDAVFVGQGFHWFAHEAALTEIHRVLRPGLGGLCLIWNREDGSNSWAADLLAIFEPLSRGIPQYWTGEWVRVWEGEWAQQHYRIPVSNPRSQSRYFRSVMQMSRQRLWQRVVSRSYVAMLPPDRLQAVKQQFDEVVARHADQFYAPAAGGAEVADVPQTTEVFIAVAQQSKEKALTTST